MGSYTRSIQILSSREFSLPLDKLYHLSEVYEDSSPETSLFDSDWVSRCCDVRDGRAYPRKLWWSGEGSVSTFDTFADSILPEFDGEADIAVLFDGGSWEGLRLREHKVSQHEVRMTLVDEASGR